MSFRRFEISDGTTTINLLSRVGGWNLVEWEPAAMTAKGDGYWIDNPLAHGRQIALKKFNNIIDTFTFTVYGSAPSSVINDIRRMRRLLERAVAYWVTPRAGVDSEGYKPVYLVLQAEWDVKPRYSIIYDYQFVNEANPLFGGILSHPPATPFTIILEHGYWSTTKPGELDSMLVDYHSTRIIDNAPQFPLASANGDGILVNQTAGTATVDYGTGYVGNYQGEIYEAAIRIPNVQFDPAVDFLERMATMVTWRVPAMQTPHLVGKRIYAELNPNPAAFTTYADYMARPRTSKFLTIPPSVSVTSFFIRQPLLFEEIVHQAGWVSGNAMVFFIVPILPLPPDTYNLLERNGVTGNFGGMQIFSFQKKVIELRSREFDDIYIPNMLQVRTSLMELHHYEASTQTFSADLLAGGPPYALLPGTPAVGDALYIRLLDYKLPHLVFDLDPAGFSFAGKWQYSSNNDASKFKDFPAGSVQDNTLGLLDGGKHAVTFLSQPYPDMGVVVPVEPNVPQGRYIRFIVTDTSVTATAPTQVDLNEFTPSTPYIELKGDQVGGDANPLLRIEVSSCGGEDVQEVRVDDVWMAMRSVNRGPDFQAFLPLGSDDGDNVPGTFVNPVASAIEAYGYPTSRGRITIGANDGAIKLVTSILFDRDLSTQYIGSYRAFLLNYHFSNQNYAPYIQFRLEVTTAPSGTTPLTYTTPWRTQSPVDIAEQKSTLTDLGAVTLPPTSSIEPTLAVRELTINIQARKTQATTPGDIIVSPAQLILLPADEYILRTRARWDSGVSQIMPVEGDGKIVMDSTLTEQLPASWMEKEGAMTASMIIEAPNVLEVPFDRDVRLFFLTGTSLDGTSTYTRSYTQEIINRIRVLYKDRAFIY